MFFIDSLQDLANRARQAFVAYLPGTDAWIQRNNIAPTAKVIAGSLNELFERLDWVFRQAFVLFATGIWLDRHGEQYGIPRLPSAPASGFVVVTAGDAIDVPAGTQFLLGNSGITFQSLADQSISGAGSLTIAVIAIAAGAASSALPNAPLTISDGSGGGVSGPGASSALAAVSAAGIDNGADPEADDPYRSRILFRMRNPPSGGNAADYVMWVRNAVPGVTRVFVEKIWRGAGTVRIFPLFDDLFAGSGGVATEAYRDSVQAALEPLQPATAIVTVALAVPVSIDVTIQGLTPDTTATRNAITAELIDMFRRKSRVSGSYRMIASMPYLAWPFTFRALWVSGAIDNAAGVQSADVIGVTDQVIPYGSIPVLGDVSFIAGS